MSQSVRCLVLSLESAEGMGVDVETKGRDGADVPGEKEVEVCGTTRRSIFPSR